jgi:ribosomal protein S21
MSRNNKNLGSGNKVIVGDMPLNTALKKFKQKVDDSGVLEIVRSKMFFE